MLHDLLHLIHYPIVALKIENQVYSSEKDILVGIVPEVALANVINKIVGRIISNKRLALHGVLEISGKRLEAERSEGAGTLKVCLAEMNGRGIVYTLGARKTNYLAADLYTVLGYLLGGRVLVGLSGMLLQ